MACRSVSRPRASLPRIRHPNTQGLAVTGVKDSATSPVMTSARVMLH